MSAWPRVLSESETLDRVLAGDSIARFGDGELKICCGGATTTHPRPSDELREELRQILLNPAPGLLPAIPNPKAVEKRWVSWSLQSPRWAKLMDRSRTYGSAFVGRPKVAPWVDTEEHRERFRDLWRGKNVVAVFPPTHPIADWLGRDARSVYRIECPKLEAYSEIDRLERRASSYGADLAVICAGPAAKPLANRLARLGMHAVDLGRGAGFVYKGHES